MSKLPDRVERMLSEYADEFCRCNVVNDGSACDSHPLAEILRAAIVEAIEEAEKRGYEKADEDWGRANQ